MKSQGRQQYGSNSGGSSGGGGYGGGYSGGGGGGSHRDDSNFESKVRSVISILLYNMHRTMLTVSSMHARNINLCFPLPFLLRSTFLISRTKSISRISALISINMERHNYLQFNLISC